MHTAALVGRQRELGAIETALDQARDGRRQVVLIEGEAGIGKTRLAQSAIEEAHRRGFVSFLAGAEYLERGRAFGPVIDALGLLVDSPDPKRADVARLLQPTELRTTTPVGAVPELQYSICEAVLELIEGHSDDGPVLLVLEDLHWADPGTLLLLRSAARRLAHHPVAILGTLRPTRPPSELDRVIDRLRADGATHIGLGPLAADAVAELVEGVTGSVVGPDLLDWVQAAGGNPFYIVELVEALAEEGSVEVPGAQAHPLELAIPPGLRLTVLRRLSHLAPASLGLLRLASLLGSTFALADLALLARRAPALLLDDLEDALKSGVLGEHGDRLAFRHDLVRESVYQDLPAAARRHLHREAADILAEAGAPAEQVASHMARGAEVGDEEAVAWLRRAARDVAPKSLGITIEFLQRAVSLAPADHHEHDHVLAELLVRLVQAGRPAEAKPIATDLLDRAPSREIEAVARDALAVALTQERRFAEAREELRKLADASWAESARRAIALADMAHASMFLGEPDEAEALGQRAIDLGGEVGDTRSVCSASMALSVVASTRGRFDEAVEHGERARSVVDSVRASGGGYPVTELVLGLALMDADRLEDALAALREGIRFAEHVGLASQVPVYHFATCGVHFFAGRWDDAVAEAEAGLEHAEETGLRAGSLVPRAILGRILLSRGDVQGADSHVTAGERELQESGPGVGGDLLLWCRALLHETNGDTKEAFATLELEWDVTRPIRYLHSYRSIAPDLVRLALAAEKTDRAGSVIDDLEEAAHRCPTATAQGVALRCRGLLNRDAEILRDALDLYRTGPRPYDLASTAEDLGRVLAGDGRRDEALLAYEEAVGGYERLGARLEIGRVMARLRELGVRRGSRARRARASMGWDALTPTELEVIRLVTEGLTNQQIGARMFVSPRTVQSHVAHALRKLGCSTRAQLAAQATRHGASAER